jgi:hypothetical protein
MAQVLLGERELAVQAPPSLAAVLVLLLLLVVLLLVVLQEEEGAPERVPLRVS